MGSGRHSGAGGMMFFSSTEVKHRLKVGFVWHGYPMYAARLLRRLATASDIELVVVATLPPFPIEPITAASPCPVSWHDRGATPPRWKAICGQIPDVVLSTGWAFPFCNSLAGEAKRGGKPVVCMADNRRRRTIRQILGAIRFRTGLRARYDGVLVPGLAAAELMHFFGLPKTRVWQGLYGADPDIFVNGPPIADRAREIVFVGQMVHRKGVDVLLEAFSRSGIAEQGWSLRTVGDGPLAKAAMATPGCIHHHFLPPEAVAALLGSAKVSVLPSRDDNWGVALHEAALAGCVIVATDAVGAGKDLLKAGSLLIVRAGDAASLANSLRSLAATDDSALQRYASESKNRAAAFGPARFANAVSDIVHTLCPHRNI